MTLAEKLDALTRDLEYKMVSDKKALALIAVAKEAQNLTDTWGKPAPIRAVAEMKLTDALKALKAALPGEIKP